METASLITSLAYEAEKAGVKIVLNQEANIDYIKKCNPDKVIVATGSTPLVPNITIKDEGRIITGVDLLLGKKWVGNNIGIIGGGMVGCEVGDYLAEYGKNVTIFEMLPEIASDMWLAVKINMVKRLKEKEVKILTSAKVSAIEDGVITYSKDGNEAKSQKFDNIIIAAGMKPYIPLKEFLDEAGVDYTIVGDAANPLRLYEALYSAVEATIKL